MFEEPNEEQYIGFTIKPMIQADRAKDYIPKDVSKILSQHLGDTFTLEQLTSAFIAVRDKCPRLASANVLFGIELSNDPTPEAHIQIHYKKKDGANLAQCELIIGKSPNNQQPTFSLEGLDVKEQAFGTSGALMDGIRRFWRENTQLKDSEFTLSAVDVGSYTWLKYGFQPNQDSWDNLRKNILKDLNYNTEKKELTVNFCDKENSIHPIATFSKISGRKYTALKTLLNSPDAKSALALANMAKEKEDDDYEIPDKIDMYPDTLGKALFCCRGWSGALNPADADAMKQFNSYIDQQLKKSQAK